MNNLNDIFFAPTASEELSYEQILEDVQRYFAENHAVAIAGEGDKGGELLQELMTQYLVKRRYTVEGLSTEELVERLYEDMAGYSFLKKWIYLTPGVEEVNINAYNDIEVIMNSGRSVKIPEKFSSPQHAIDVVRRMLSSCGMILDDTMPSVVGYLDKNIRISVDKTPIVDPDVGLNASIRIVNQQTVSKEKLLESGSATSEMLEFLTACTTIHSNSCASTYRRMMTLAKRKYMMSDEVLMQIMVEAYPIVVYTKQLEDRSRKIMEIIEGEGYEDGRLIYRSLYKYEVADNTIDENGEPHVVGRHRKGDDISGNLRKRFLDNGISFKELEVFSQEPSQLMRKLGPFPKEVD